MLSNAQKLDMALSFVKGIKKDFNTLYQSNKKIFDSRKELHDAFVNFFTEIDKSLHRLEHPVLSIATIGTTSAGKSTIVNALSGRTIAPMESQEMSAGVLRLIPSKEISLEIAKSPYWESGKFSPITDKEAYKKIERIFEDYKKFEKITIPPDITVRGPLLWDSHPELLGLPSNISIEFVDLPGLKTLSDEKNLHVIQQHLSRSLCIIAMDYNDVGQDRIGRLLEELDDIVKALSGNDDSILFLLTKVDARSATDKPLCERIEILSNLIKNRLSLEKHTKIKIIPFISRLLYYAQAAIGTSFYTDNKISHDIEYIEKLNSDHTNTFRSKDFSSAEIRNFYNHKILLEDDLQSISSDDILELIKYSYEISHGNELLAELKRRIQESFTTVIIQPAMNDTEKSLNSLLSKLQTYVTINKFTNELELLTEQVGLAQKKFKLFGTDSTENYNNLTNDITNIFKNLSKINIEPERDKIKKILLNRLELLKKDAEKKQPGEIDKRFSDLEKNTTEIGNRLASILERGENIQKEINNYLSQQQGINPAFNVFSKLSNVPQLIKDRLKTQIIIPFRTHLIGNKGKGALETDLKKYLPTVLVAPLLPHYETVKRTFAAWQAGGYTQEADNFVYQTKQELSSKELDDTREMYDSLNRRMRYVLSKKSNILFQLEANNFAILLRGFIQSEFGNLVCLLKKNLGETSIDLSKMIETALIEKEQKIDLPEELFQFSSPSVDSSIRTNYEKKIVGTKTVGSCCNRRTENVTKTVGINIYKYKFHNANGIQNSWSAGMDASEAVFWKIITDWVNKTIEDYLSNLKNVSKDMISTVNDMISVRLAEKNEDIIAKGHFFDTMSKMVDKTETTKNDFKRSIS